MDNADPQARTVEIQNLVASNELNAVIIKKTPHVGVTPGYVQIGTRCKVF